MCRFAPWKPCRLFLKSILSCFGKEKKTVTELVRAAETNRRWEGIKGLVYREGSDIHQTADRGYVQDVNALPAPARHLLPLGRYRALNLPITMTTSRGCPFRCIFCVGRQMVGPKVRYWSPTQVVDELEQLSTLNFLQVNIADDLFTANKKHCHAVCDEMIRRDLKTPPGPRLPGWTRSPKNCWPK